MEEYNGIHNARKYEQTQNHSLTSMSTTRIFIISKTKKISAKWEKRSLLRMHLKKTVSCLLEARDVRWPNFIGIGTEKNAFPFKKDLFLSKGFFSLSWNGSFLSFQSFFGLVIPFFAVLFQFFHLSTFLNPFHIF